MKLASLAASLVVANSSRDDAYLDAGYAGEDDIAGVQTDLESAGVQAEVRRPVRGAEAAEEVVTAAVKAPAGGAAG